MPLLKKIPLCNFKYVENTLSNTVFRYSNDFKLIKHNKIYLEVKNDINLNKNNKKYLYQNGNNEINNINDKKYFYENNNNEIDKKDNVNLYKNNIYGLGRNKEIILKKYKIDNIFACNKIKSCDELECALYKGIYERYLSRDINFQMLKKENFDFVNYIIEKQLAKHKFIKNLYKNKEFNIEICSYVISIIKKYIEIHIESGNKFFNSIQLNHINKFKESYIDSKQFDLLYKNEYINMVNHNVVKNIAINEKTKFLDRNIFHTINLNKKYLFMYIEQLKKIDKIKDIYIDSIQINDMEKQILLKYMYIEVMKDIFKRKVIYINKNSCNYIYKNIEQYLNRKYISELIRNDNKYLGRKYIKNIFKDETKFLNDLSYISIFKDMNKSLLNIVNVNVFKDINYAYLTMYDKNISKENENKDIEITKRWWWLKSIGIKDNLVIPNKDFVYNSDLLNNKEFEYLTFTNHPIELGEKWGMDYNIPPSGVSIEILVDLINILVMVWHKNIQGWMCCTGKEAMQFIIEILYNWYMLESSNPNSDYYRAYRWIRWEAEKVFFKDFKDGLQSVGVLIANLIEYMKYHHYNLNPIWRNAKSFDIERCFNRNASNGDMILASNKNKSIRHYYVEEQKNEDKRYL